MERDLRKVIGNYLNLPPVPVIVDETYVQLKTNIFLEFMLIFKLMVKLL